jgi:hypothetical protein
MTFDAGQASHFLSVAALSHVLNHVNLAFGELDAPLERLSGLGLFFDFNRSVDQFEQLVHPHLCREDLPFLAKHSLKLFYGQSLIFFSNFLYFEFQLFSCAMWRWSDELADRHLLRPKRQSFQEVR